MPERSPYRLRAAVLAGTLVALAPWPTPTATASAASATAAIAVAPRAGRCATPAPTTAAGYQTMFDRKNDETWAAGDQASSVRLPDGRTLWLFGDTFAGARRSDGRLAPGWRMVHNSVLLQDGGCLRAVRGPRGREAIPDAANGDFYWPRHAVVDGGRLLVFASRTRATSPEPLGFTGTGMEVAVFSLPRSRAEAPAFLRMARTVSSGRPETFPQYGAAIAADRTYQYVYATAKVDQPYHFGRSVYVARVRPGKLLTPSAWRYWTGGSWSAVAAAAQTIVRSAPAGWSASFSVHRTAGGSFRVVTKENEFLGSAIVSGSSASAVGPFTRSVVRAAPSDLRSGSLAYLAMAHPQARLHAGVLASYCRNTTTLPSGNPLIARYKPVFFAIPSR